mmetsp:Transcript_51914/g.153027  ORF Transcript_51914/g.153027 Transcript_51914/m.153027 type:complete len:225 (-) Transcript_51914:1088-1762(-)
MGRAAGPMWSIRSPPHPPATSLADPGAHAAAPPSGGLLFGRGLRRLRRGRLRLAGAKHLALALGHLHRHLLVNVDVGNLRVRLAALEVDTLAGHLREGRVEDVLVVEQDPHVLLLPLLGLLVPDPADVVATVGRAALVGDNADKLIVACVVFIDHVRRHHLDILGLLRGLHLHVTVRRGAARAGGDLRLAVLLHQLVLVLLLLQTPLAELLLELRGRDVEQVER